MKLNKSDWRNYEEAIQKEWILTNGLGGFSSSTVIGANARRYHGLLFASFNPPVGRHLMLSKIDESVFIDGAPYNIYSFSTGEYKMTGFNHQQEFSLDPLPKYKYIIKNVVIEKTVTMVHGKNAVALVYRVKNTEHMTKMRLAILTNYRDFHSVSNQEDLDFNVEHKKDEITINHKDDKHFLKVMTDNGQIKSLYNTWFKSMFYDYERERGLDAFEDHYIPGYIEISVEPWEEKIITIYAEVVNDSGLSSKKCPDGLKLIQQEEDRIASVQNRIDIDDDFAKRLAKAADDFIVRRESTNAKTIVAGYPWFSDWGRDAMISLTGLTLATNRFQNAKQILFTYSKYIKDGLIPNMFPDAGSEPLYNSVDAALWFFEAINNYIGYTKDIEFIKMNMYSSMCSIIESFKKGTEFNIFMDDDGLISAGDENTQLTWMDAKVDDWVVTPRQGKAVEINALWYNALKIIEKITKSLDEDTSEFKKLSAKVRKSFEEKFWNEDTRCLYDVIGSNFIDSKIRPNQIFALSLSYPVITGDKAECIVHKVWDELYTPLGLRSLADYETGYKSTYTGTRYSRDGAYHQGTVWGYLIGPFITAFLRTYKDKKAYVKEMIEPFKNHLLDGCLGSVAEIFEAEEPHKPKGSFAQAWSIAELLRVYIENKLYE
jgi:predicted glycogen debranching enzyme